MQNESETSQILGIDFGTAKVGLAMADTETKIAFAYAILKHDENFMKELTKIIEKENIKRIIIGVPIYKQLEKKETAGEKLGEKIKAIFPQMEVEYQNEMFTTKSAQDNLIAKGMKNVGKYDDAEAAKIILQEFLDKV
ncbi:MAG: Holliday junction resolvase RuvX [Parcubacteria group bacterium]